MSLSKDNLRSRAWIMTIHKDLPNSVRKLETMNFEYVVWQTETTQKGGLHLQIYLYWKSARTFKRMKTLFPGAHIEIARGSAASNKAYCTKEKSKVVGASAGERGLFFPGWTPQ